MSKIRSTEPRSESESGFSRGSLPSRAPELESKFQTASHAVLFETVEDVRCDVCGAPASSDDRSEDSGFAGEGLYLWVRGDEVRRESVPLCTPCASAIGMTALARWEIEEEEG